MSKTIFLSYETEYLPVVRRIKTYVQQKIYDTQFLECTPGSCPDQQWKARVKKMLYQSDGVFCFIGRSTYQSHPINWEIEQSILAGTKIVIIYLDAYIPCYPRALDKASLSKYLRYDDWEKIAKAAEEL